MSARIFSCYCATFDPLKQRKNAKHTLQLTCSQSY